MNLLLARLRHILLRSTKSSKTPAGRRRLKLETLETNMAEAGERIETQRQQFELKLTAEQQTFMVALEDKQLEADGTLKLMEQD